VDELPAESQLARQEDLRKVLLSQQRLEEGLEEVLRRIKLFQHHPGSTSRSVVAFASPYTSNAAAPPASNVEEEKEEEDQPVDIHWVDTCDSDPRPRIHEVASKETLSSSNAASADGTFRLRPAFEEHHVRIEELGYDTAVATIREASSGASGANSGSFTTGLWRAAASGPNVGDFERRGAVKVARFMIHPASKVTSFMDILNCVFMLLDVVFVPYLLAWQPPPEDFIHMATVVAAFWTIDIVVNFRTGYVRTDGIVVTNPYKVSRRYCRRAFALDFTVVVADICDLTIGYGSPGTSPEVQKVLRFLKVIRFFRIARKLRAGMLARMHEAFLRGVHLFGHLHWLPMVDLGVLVLKLLLAITFIGHIGACVWHSLEESNDVKEQESWQGEQQGLMPSYMRGFYWAVSTVFSGASHLNPLNIFEAVLSVVWLVLGAMFVTSVTSTMAATLIESQSRQHDAKTKLQALTTFLHQRHAPMRLALALHSDLIRKLEDTAPVTEHDLPIHLVSPHLRAALREALYAPALLQTSGFFRMIATVQDGFMKRVCFRTADVSVRAAGDIVFHQLQDYRSAHLVSRGRFSYSFTPKRRPVVSKYESAASSLTRTMLEESVVEEGALVCEWALLLRWQTRGRMSAQTSGELFTISAARFIKEVMDYPSVALAITSYGARLCHECNFRVEHDEDEGWRKPSKSAFLPARNGEGVGCSDLTIGIDYDVVASNLAQAIRSDLLSQPILESLRYQNENNFWAWRSRKSWLELEQEVKAGKCHLVRRGPLESHGFLRIVRIVLLHLRNRDGLLCVQLAHCSGGQDSVDLNFPGAKVLGDETPEVCVKRLLRERLWSLEPSISIVSSQTKIEVQASASFGMTTKYIKTIFEAQLKGDLANDVEVPRIRSPAVLGAENSAGAMVAMGSMQKLSTSSQSKRSVRAPSSPFPVVQQLYDLLVGHSSCHGFAVSGEGCNLDVDFLACGTTSMRTESDVGDDFYLYQWLRSEDAKSLRKSTGESNIEADLHAVLRYADLAFWQRLLGWHVCAPLKVSTL